MLTLEQLVMRNGKPVYIVENGDDHWELCARGSDYLQGRDITMYGDKWKAYDREPQTGIFKDVYCDVHAVYDPDGSEHFGDCHCAAVDLLAPGLTFRVYFKGEQVEHVERWHFG